MPIDTDDLASALLRKGFRLKEGDHKIYYFFVGEKKSSVFTKISHGSSYKQYGDGLTNSVKKQMGLTTSELQNFIECSLTQDQYTSLLRERSRIK